jgi:hypothetical protein
MTEELNLLLKEFTTLLNNFDYHFTGYDKIWTVILPVNSRRWVEIHVQLYNGNYYLSEQLHDYPDMIFENSKKGSAFENKNNFGYKRSNGETNVWVPILKLAIEHLKKCNKNWILENEKIQNNFPIKYKRGVINQAILNHYLPDLINIKKNIGPQLAKQIVALIDSNYFNIDEDKKHKTFTANKYFEYCKVAYNAIDEKLDNNIKNNGLALYNRFADGRHEGLINIKLDSPTEFKSWINHKHPKYVAGGHPFEIYRAGIFLYVNHANYRDDDGFTISLNGNALYYLKKICQIILALKKANLPFTFSASKELRLRIMAQDFIGIVPENESLKYAENNFEKENVFDVVYLDDINKKMKQLAPFIIWEQLPILKPKVF